MDFRNRLSLHKPGRRSTRFGSEWPSTTAPTSSIQPPREAKALYYSPCVRSTHESCDSCFSLFFWLRLVLSFLLLPFFPLQQVPILIFIILTFPLSSLLRALLQVSCMTSHLDSRFPNREPILSRSSKMPSAIVLGLRAAQLIMAIVILGLSAYGTSYMHRNDPMNEKHSHANTNMNSRQLVQRRYLDLVPVSGQLAPVLLALHHHLDSLP